MKTKKDTQIWVLEGDDSFQATAMSSGFGPRRRVAALGWYAGLVGDGFGEAVICLEVGLRVMGLWRLGWGGAQGWSEVRGVGRRRTRLIGDGVGEDGH